MNLEFRKKLLLSVQRALLGMIYPSIRGIAVGCDNETLLKIIYYLDKEPDEEDYENIREVTSEVCADINFTEVEEFCVFSDENISNLNSLSSWVYLRKEN
ncbi:MAG: hypothetical protein ACK5B9_11385 [Flavobacteriia bacterium]|jgi:hypothetical protein